MIPGLRLDAGDRKIHLSRPSVSENHLSVDKQVRGKVTNPTEKYLVNFFQNQTVV